MGVSLNGGTPKSSILIGFSIVNHPFWGTIIFGNPQMKGFKHHSYLTLQVKLASLEKWIMKVGRAVSNWGHGVFFWWVRCIYTSFLTFAVTHLVWLHKFIRIVPTQLGKQLQTWLDHWAPSWQNPNSHPTFGFRQFATRLKRVFFCYKILRKTFPIPNVYDKC